MSELLDKKVNAQKEKTSGVHASSRKPTKKVCDENERNKQRRKNDARVKIIFMEGSPLKRPCEEPVKTICMNLKERRLWIQ